MLHAAYPRQNLQQLFTLLGRHFFDNLKSIL